MDEIKPPTFAELRRKHRAGKLTKNEAAALADVFAQTVNAFHSKMSSLQVACRNFVFFARGAMWGARASRSESVPESRVKDKVFKALRSLKAGGTPRGDWARIIEDRGITSGRTARRFVQEFKKEEEVKLRS